MGIGCGKFRAPPPNKARDIFASVDDLIPSAFTGARFHVLVHTGELKRPFDSDRRPPTSADDEAKCGWSAAGVLRLGMGGMEPGNVWLSSQWNFWSAIGCLFTAADLEPVSGKWNLETMGRSADGQIDASVVAQVCAWNYPRSVQINVDKTIPGKAASLSVDPILKKCSFGYIQAVSDRLSLGFELAFGKSLCIKGKPTGRFQPTVMAKYAGPEYLVSVKASPFVGSIKLAYYQHWSDRMQFGCTVQAKDGARQMLVIRPAFRVLTDNTVFRAAIGTDGIVNGHLERRIGDRLSVSLSGFLSHACKDGRFGVGLSFVN